MALKGYTTEEEVENYGLIDIDDSFSSQIDGWIESIEKFIEQYTGRIFILDAEDDDTEKLYDGDGSNILLIDDALSISEIAFSDEALSEDATYYLYPSNNTPKTKIILEGTFPRGRQNIKITGQFAFSFEVPTDIMLAATILVTGIINYGKGPGKSGVRSETIGRYSVTFSDEKGWQDFRKAISILSSYKRYSF